MKLTQILLPILLLASTYCEAQIDSTIEVLQKIPVKYISKIDNKIDKYSSRITSKTEKTLTKLSRWENKIKSLLEQVSPETAQKLFGNNQTTFSTLLQKVKEGEAIADGYKTQYDEYRDKLTTSIKYLEQQKNELDKNLIDPINETKKKLNALEEDVSNTEAVEQFIKERKKQLIDETVKSIGKSKYLKKIDKESYYYIETIRNYKEIFSDKKKAEELVVKILNKIPAFNKFIEENSMFASLFHFPGGSGNCQQANIAGLQTTVNVQTILQNRIAAGGPNALDQVRQNLQQGQAELNELKNRVVQGGGTSGDANIPDFKPNNQKTKIFFQRLEYGGNFQNSKSNGLTPAILDIALNVGYKINDRSIVGIGTSYKMGFGSIQRISISHQGVGLRSYIDWKLKKNFFISGGFEMNYITGFKKIDQLKYYNDWQQSGLLGITKKINIKTKFAKATKVQLLYDMLAMKHRPTSQPVLFRIGYQF